MRRRAFLRWAAGGLLASRAPLVAGRDWLPDFTTISLPDTGLSGAQWRVVDAVQQHLFPSEARAPGAREANALPWLQWVLSAPDLEPGTQDFHRRNVQALIALAEKRFDAPFPGLSVDRKETLLREFEQQGEGRAWLREILDSILEALLGDPVYGGNPGGIGWKWLRHRPGYKRPPADKRYFLL